MTDINLTKAAHDITLIMKDGNEVTYQLVPLTDRDYDELDNWVKEQIIESAVQGAKHLEPSIQKLVIDSAVAQASGASWLTPTGTKLIVTPRGIARMLWQSIKRNHSTITYKEILSAMFDERNMKDSEVAKNVRSVTDKVAKANGFSQQKTAAKKNQDLKKRRKTRTNSSSQESKGT